MSSSEPPAALRSRHDLRTRRVQGFPCTTVAPRGGGSGRAVVYLHGGSYTGEIAPQHWALISKLADAGVRVAAVGLAAARCGRVAALATALVAIVLPPSPRTPAARRCLRRPVGGRRRGMIGL